MMNGSLIIVPLSLGYAAVAKLKGASIDDSVVYFSFSYMSEMLKVYQSEDINPEKIILKDEKEGIGSFELEILTESTENGLITINYILTINTEADYSKIKESVEDLKTGLEESFNTMANQLVGSLENGLTINSQTNNKITSNINKIPQTGTSFDSVDVLKIIIVVSVIGIILIIIASKKYRKV